MANRDLEQGWHYHNATKHSYWSVHNNRHFLDWPNQPLPFKIYSRLAPIPLATESPASVTAALKAISETPPALRDATGERVPTLDELARILYYSGGITRRRKYPAGEVLFRAASCTGALYEIELYLVCGDLAGLAAGVYHWNPGDGALRRLRPGDHRGVIAQATAQEPAVSRAPLLIVCSATYWRNAWKYQARTYRHFGWDNGTLLANLLAVCAALALPAKLLEGFLDAELNRLLDLDTDKEVSFSLVAVGAASTAPAAPPAELPALNLETEPLSASEVDYPLMRAMHRNSALETAGEVAAWRAATAQETAPAAPAAAIPLEPLGDDEIPHDPLEEVILRRGSSRGFAREPIGYRQFSTILDRATRGIAADFLNPFGSQLNDLYVIVNAIEGLPAGSYFFHRDPCALELLKKGDFRSQAGYLGLEQQIPADASACFFFLADLKAVFERFGNRGYRAVQTEAGIIGGKIYLAAYAQRLGASGLTFFDDDVVEFLSPHAAGKSAVFLVAVGQRRRRKRA